MNYRREDISNYYLWDTHLENIFINEYMIHADGDYVKVYIYALMHADNPVVDNQAIAKALGIPAEKVLMAWTYWEEQGVVLKHYKNAKDKFDYVIEFLNLKEMAFQTSTVKKEKRLTDRVKGLMDNADVRKMYRQIEKITGRILESNEITEIPSWIQDYNISPDYVVFAYRYCVEKRNNNKYKYVASVVREWAHNGLLTVEKVEAHLTETDNRYYQYKRIFRALGFSRMPSEQERAIMDSWFDEMNLTIETILEACKKTSGISNPNLNYINAVLLGSKKGHTVKSASQSQISAAMKMYEEIRFKTEQDAQKRKEEVYQKVPRIREIEEMIQQSGIAISKLMLSGGSNISKEIKEIRNQSQELQAERAFLLTENNYMPDYLDVKHVCEKCSDTGVLESGERCTCFGSVLQKVSEEQES